MSLTSGSTPGPNVNRQRYTLQGMQPSIPAPRLGTHDSVDGAVWRLHTNRRGCGEEIHLRAVINAPNFASKFPNFHRWKSQGGVLPNYFQKFGSYWGSKKLEPLASKFWSPFQICVAPAHKGVVRRTTSRTQQQR